MRILPKVLIPIFLFIFFILPYRICAEPVRTFKLRDTLPKYEGPDLEDWYRTPCIENWDTREYKSYLFNGLSIRIIEPKTFHEDSLKNVKYPVVFYLHGYGDKGPPEDNESQLKVEGKFFKELHDKDLFKGFIVFPQNNDGYWTQPDLETIHKLITFLIHFEKVDPLRIFFKGYSAGGGALWRFIRDYPLQVSSGMFIGHPGGAGEYNPETLLGIPVWVCQGYRDGQNPPQSAHWFLDYLRGMGIPIHYTEYPEGKHDLSKETEADPFFLKFLNDSHKLNPQVNYYNPKNPTVKMKFPILYISKGYSEYQWSKNGIIMENEKLNYLKVLGPGNYKVRVKMDNEWTEWTPKKILFNESGTQVEN